MAAPAPGHAGPVRRGSRTSALIAAVGRRVAPTGAPPPAPAGPARRASRISAPTGAAGPPPAPTAAGPMARVGRALTRPTCSVTERAAPNSSRRPLIRPARRGSSTTPATAAAGRRVAPTGAPAPGPAGPARRASRISAPTGAAGPPPAPTAAGPMARVGRALTRPTCSVTERAAPNSSRRPLIRPARWGSFTIPATAAAGRRRARTGAPPPGPAGSAPLDRPSSQPSGRHACPRTAPTATPAPGPARRHRPITGTRNWSAPPTAPMPALKNT